MNEKILLYEILKECIQESPGNSCKPNIPLFSFEGLPGSGKTTQISMVAQKLEKNQISSSYIEIPTAKGVGRLLKSAYSNPETWSSLRQELPWLNPVLLSVDLITSLQKAELNKKDVALMSRGILSTYYYNIDAYYGTGNPWTEIKNDLCLFPKPNVIFFLDLPPQTAHQRVVERKRGTLRKMDMTSSMRRDRLLFELFCSEIDNTIPVHHIDATKSEDEIANEITSIIVNYLDNDINKPE